MNFSKKLVVPFDKKFRLEDRDAGNTEDNKHDEKIEEKLKKNIERIAQLQFLLYAEHKQSLLIILQGMDSSGKDGTIRHVMTGLNPQSCRVASFKAPSSQELDHDYLWRIHKEVPAKGEIVIFNRSHYEDVLVVRVHDMISEKVLKKRFKQINDFEEYLAENDVKILKFFLQISKEEQKERIQKRISDPQKNWKFDPSDVKERTLWKDYIEAYEDVFNNCNKPWAPWFIIPADKKWFRNLAVSQIIENALEEMDPKQPKPKADLKGVVVK